MTDDKKTVSPRARLWRDAAAYVSGVAVWTVIRVFAFHDAFWSSVAQGVVLMAVLLYVMIRTRRGRDERS
ncbi:MAG TPA: hypothetical protein VHX59_12030 [Mycobacteriales bacterium]|nr:hypothetical protein [Mycobacteriales bacterium]